MCLFSAMPGPSGASTVNNQENMNSQEPGGKYKYMCVVVVFYIF